MSITFQPETSPQIVVIGGGNGTSTLLEGLRHYDLSLTAVVATTDNGGSSGILRKQYPGLIGIGDIRQCLRALAQNEELADSLDERTSNGHAKGNLEIINRALKLGGVAYLEESIEQLGNILAVKGSVLPVSLDNSHLMLSFPEDIDEPVKGEFQISHFNKKNIRSRLGELSLSPTASLNPSAEKAILEARAIVLAPGNFYSSIIPPLLTDGIRETLEASNSPLVMISNLVNGINTKNFSVADYVDELNRQAGIKPDIVIAHDPEGPEKKINELVSPLEIPSIELIKADLLICSNDNYSALDSLAASRSRYKHNAQAIGNILLHSL
jgi:uncharacterized cofD-like protein